MGNHSLVLGGNGFLGRYIVEGLVREGVSVRCIGRRSPREDEVIPQVEYIIGDAFDSDILNEALKDVDVVYDFISTSMPNGGEKDLAKEIEGTLKTLDELLFAMVSAGVKNIVYPSSGGAIYGDQTGHKAAETQALFPTTPYGVGKQLSEEILSYYCRKYGLNACVFRIGNVYGSKQFRDKPQGVIDVFVQHALQNQPIMIWGDASKSIRDYVYLEDAAEAIVKTSLLGFQGMQILNVGTGKGTSVQDIVDLIEKKLGEKIAIERVPQKTSGISSIVLDCSKIESVSGWTPRVPIELGIEKTIRAKKALLCDR